MTPGRLLRLLRAGWVMACGLAVVGYSLSFAGLFQEGGWEVLKVWQPWLLLSLGIAGLAVIRLSLRRAEVQLAPLVPRRVSAPTSPRQTAAYPIAPDPGVATVAVVIHGVGDHSGGDMLARAETGLAAFAGAPFACQHIEIQGLRHLDESGDGACALRVESAGLTHFVLPVTWSGLKPRSARAITQGGNTVELIMRALWQLLPGVWNSLRCIGKADGLGRRLLVGALGLLYACLAPGLLIGTVAFITYVAFARAEADFTLFEWWRIPALLIGLLLIRLVIRQVLTACDFVADVANYVGNPAHRKEAEDRLIALLRELGERYPAAKIVLVGHSLGSVLVSQGVLRLNDGEAITQRLLLVTMGSPLRIMAWFFPDHIRSPIGLLHQYVDRRLVMAWANLWRDADFIGRGLGQEFIAEARSGFAETSLGDGTHPDYWSDPRCWQAIVQFLDAAGGGAQQDLASTWAERMTEGEEAELQRRASLAVKFALGITPLAATALFYGLEWIRNHAWLAAMSPRSRWLVLALTGVSVVLFTVYYYFTSRRVGGDGASRRTMLARYRLYWTAGMACAQPAALAAFAAGFLLWRFYPG